MFCSSCGTKKHDGAKFCTGCGAANTVSTNQFPSRDYVTSHALAPSKKLHTKKIVFIAVAVVLLATVAAFVVFYGVGNNGK